MYEMISKGKRVVALGYFSAMLDGDQTLPYMNERFKAVISQ